MTEFKRAPWLLRLVCRLTEHKIPAGPGRRLQLLYGYGIPVIRIVPRHRKPNGDWHCVPCVCGGRSYNRPRYELRRIDAAVDKLWEEPTER